jgi:hypothetical protein
MDAESTRFRKELSGLILASMAGAAIKDSVRTTVTRGREPKVDVDLERAARLLKGLSPLAIAAADELLTELEKPR